MKLGERIRDLFVLRINLAYPVHSSHPDIQLSAKVLGSLVWREMRPLSRNTNYFPSVALIPNQTAPRKPVAITVITALKV
jgi:hypothetical protein